ncbi:putative P-loop containing nucleoside triphosphate hydrolase, leucine-rich repeat domain superfamily [Helianthus annuus]|nr:putative P-loop containing nucleoside triphosphate hydrolase, leucine-rich repeat domain superfamily [Helianthus annuus]
MHEAKVIKLIVEEISLELRSINVNIDHNLVGMGSRLQRLQTSLDVGSEDVRMIGIKGMGGAGKTTLAGATFDILSIHFEAKTFVENVREISKAPSGLLSLQKKILTDLDLAKGNNVSSVHEGTKLMKTKLRGRKVLMVLDDVDHQNQLDALAGDIHWFKPGSRIIITTRDEQVLIAHKIERICDVNLLSNEEAITLFSRHAFGKDTLVKELKTILLKETLEKLELSYASLDDDCKEIFLDVACILKGWEKDKAISMLESCGFHGRIGLRVLEQRSLITFHENHFRLCLSMHDHIEEMGKNIVRRLHPDEPNKHSRLWIQEEIEYVLNNDLGSEATRCIRLKVTPDIVLEGLGNMKKLRCLFVDRKFEDHYDHVNIDEVLKKLKSIILFYSELRTLDLGLTPNLVRLDLSFCDDLVELHVPVGCLKSLTYLNLGHCKRLKSISFIKDLESLEVLDVSYLHLKEFQDIIPCHSNSNLRQLNFSGNDIENLPSSIGNLHKLVNISFSRCYKLKSLPGSICSLQHLKVLNLGYSGIEELPEDIGQLECLEELDLTYSKIKHLPDSICKLKHLKALILKFCKVCKLPEDVGQIDSLSKLDLRFSKIRDVPSSFCKLKHLKELDLSGCSELEKLPENLGDLESLNTLSLTGTKIRDLPSSICKLKHLKELELSKCFELEKLPENLGDLESLNKLRITCAKIREVPSSICKLKHLKELYLSECNELEKLPENLGDIESLNKLRVRCTKIRDVPSSNCKLKRLEILNLSECNELEKLPENLGDIESLNKLRVRCTKIRDVPSSICKLKRLEILNLSECNELEKLPENREVTPPPRRQNPYNRTLRTPQTCT